MNWLPGLAFDAPWALGLLALLPVLWQFLRVIPPQARRVRFPAIRLLLGLKDSQEQPESTPPWLLVLRLALAAVLILAAARPLLDPIRPARFSGGALVVVIDDGWAAARDWSARRLFLDRRLARAERLGQSVLLLTTAPPADGGAASAGRLMPAAEARTRAAGLDPKPWATDRRAALAALKALNLERVAEVLWLSDGLAGDGAAELARALQALGGGLTLAAGQTARLLLPPVILGESLAPVVRRLDASAAERVTVRGLDGSGTVLVRQDAVFEAGRSEVTVPLVLPADLRNRLVRLELEGEASAAATLLLDEGWRRRMVGLAGSNQGATALLDPLYYVERALAPHAELKRGALSEMVEADSLSVLVLADVPLSAGNSAERLENWVRRGGVLLRFAGPLLAEAAGGAKAADPFLPVRLRDGGRALGGAMSWTSPMALAPFAAASPFAGLGTPADVEVRSQVLAEPSLDLASHVWASLTDGTPLVTALRRGQGWVVLVHTSSNADWSNLALSGLFVDMLRRVVALSQGALPPDTAQAALPPALVLDGQGRLHPSSGVAAAITEGLSAAKPGPSHPPGLYGPEAARVAFNLSPRLEPLRRLPPPPGTTETALADIRSEIDLGPALLVAAIGLVLADLLASLVLRGVLRRAGPVLLLLAAAGPAGAAEPSAFALESGLATRLACLRTHDAAIDRECMAGLKGLSALLTERSTADLAEPMLADPERDPVLFFPLVYWRITPGQKPLSQSAVERLNAYMAKGGMMVFDTAEGMDATRLRDLVQGLVLPPLAPLAPDHVLNRSFYLLKESPGRFDGPAPWVERGGSGGNDGVSPLVLGSNDWIGAWAVDERGRPLHAVVPGGERQREMAYRFGINVVMYALTGNYKADQVHLPAILERLAR
ncbi:conserved hypothetical protein [Candidatus Terasakiella magnetica]|nr:conserved hypothetical protein [Candidatus Terasakiella magnetica]